MTPATGAKLSGKTVAATGYYLTNTTPGHNKYYLITVSDDHVVTFSWGRIGAAGTSKVQVFSNATDADTIAKKQFYAKRSGGYDVIVDSFRFQVPVEAMEAATKSGYSALIDRWFWRAQDNPEFEADAQSVLTHYDELLRKAQALMDKASTMNFESVQAQFDELEAQWAEIEDKHDTAKVTMDFTRQMLGAALLSGKL